MKPQQLKKMALAVTVCVLALGPVAVQASVTPEEAAKLGVTGTPLTPVGAERAANADGSIPAWDGGYTTPVPGYKPGDVRPDPFAGEKPLITITAANYKQYADKLSVGVQALFDKYPDYKINIYPTHRTAAYPAYIYDNTKKNAVTATTTNGGLTVTGAFGGIPFPIPKDGFEAAWNHLFSYQGTSTEMQYSMYQVEPNGTKTRTVVINLKNQYPYYYPDKSLETTNGDFIYINNSELEPPHRAGQKILVRDPVDFYVERRKAWQYLTGQRRLRKAPTIAFDTPNFYAPTVKNWDDNFIFNGSLERYTWKLVGKKEMYVPYNANGFYQQKTDDVIGPNFVNPEHVRWELHRVWVVEAELAPGQRHVVPKRTIYLDEDTWQGLLTDEYDAKGALWKVGHLLPLIVPECPCVVRGTDVFYNLQNGAYSTEFLLTDPGNKYIFNKELYDENALYTPEALAGGGVR